MVVAVLMGLVETELPGFEWLKNVPKLKPEQIVYVGLRDVDLGEKKILRDLNIKALTMNAVDKYGIGKTMEMALDHLGDRPLHLSYDIDAIDPGERSNNDSKMDPGPSPPPLPHHADDPPRCTCTAGAELYLLLERQPRLCRFRFRAPLFKNNLKNNPKTTQPERSLTITGHPTVVGNVVHILVQCLHRPQAPPSEVGSPGARPISSPRRWHRPAN